MGNCKSRNDSFLVEEDPIFNSHHVPEISNKDDTGETLNSSLNETSSSSFSSPNRDEPDKEIEAYSEQATNEKENLSSGKLCHLPEDQVYHENQNPSFDSDRGPTNILSIHSDKPSNSVCESTTPLSDQSSVCSVSPTHSLTSTGSLSILSHMLPSPSSVVPRTDDTPTDEVVVLSKGRMLRDKKRQLEKSFCRKSTTETNPRSHYEILPRHMIRLGKIGDAISTLKDERFVEKRIEKLGVLYAAKTLIKDVECLSHREKQIISRGINKLKSESNIISSVRKNDDPLSKSFSLLSKTPDSSFPDGEDSKSVGVDSIYLFRHCIMKKFKLQLVHIEFGGDDQKDSEEDGAVGLSKSKFPSTVETGTAFYSLGKWLHVHDLNEDAMVFYKHSLYFLLKGLNVAEEHLLETSAECPGEYYVKLLNVESKVDTPNSLIASLLAKMGDLHGMEEEHESSLQAYTASHNFYDRFLLDFKDVDKSKERMAAMEGLALIHNRIGGVFCTKGDLTNAKKSFSKAIALLIDCLGENHIEVAKTLHNIGVIHRHNTELDTAFDYYSRAHCIFEKNLGSDNLDTVRTLNNMGGIFRRQKEYEKAMDCFHEVLRVRRLLLGDNHSSVSLTIVSMAAVLRRSGKKEEANKYYKMAMQ